MDLYVYSLDLTSKSNPLLFQVQMLDSNTESVFQICECQKSLSDTSKRNLSNRLDSRPASKICFDVRQEMFLSHRQTKLVKIFRVGQVWVLALSAGMPGSLELDKGAERAKLVDIYLILPGTASRGKCRVQVCSVPNLVPGDEEMKMLPSRNLKSCQKLLEDCCNIINW